MKIAFDIRPLIKKKTGIGYYTESLLKALLAVDHESSYVLYARKSPFSRKKRIPQFDAQNVTYAIDRFRFMRAWGIRNCDIVVTSGYDLPKKKGQRMVVIVHDVVHKAFPEGHASSTSRTVDEGLKRVAKDADAFVVISESTKQDLMRFYDISQERIFKIYSGSNFCLEKPDVPFARQILAERFQIHRDYILFLGTLEPRKNIENLLRAYKKICERGATIPLVIAGMKGWMFDGIFETVKELSLTDRVIFTDYISHEEKQCLYRMAKIFVYPSLYEGFGLPILEAMDYGVPVITSNCSALPEVAGDAAILVDPCDPLALADAMDQLLNNGPLRDRLITKGAHRTKVFDWRLTAQGFLDLFNFFAKQAT